MRIQIKKEGLVYHVKEADRVIYTIKQKVDEQKITVMIYNLYEQCVMTLTTHKKWYAKVLPMKKQVFTFEEDGETIGSLQPCRRGYEATYHGVIYRFFGGKEDDVFCIRGYDRKHQEVHMMMYEEMKVMFRNTSMQVFFIAVGFCMKEFAPLHQFDTSAYTLLEGEEYQDIYTYVQE